MEFQKFVCELLSYLKKRNLFLKSVSLSLTIPTTIFHLLSCGHNLYSTQIVRSSPVWIRLYFLLIRVFFLRPGCDIIKLQSNNYQTCFFLIIFKFLLKRKLPKLPDHRPKFFDLFWKNFLDTNFQFNLLPVP